MRRIYLDTFLRRENELLLSGSVVHYLRDVLRMRRGDLFQGFDGRGREYILRIILFEIAKVRVLVEEEKEIAKEDSLFPVELCVALSRRKSMDEIVERCSELGIETITIFPSFRSVVALKKEEYEERITRWQRIAAQGVQVAGKGGVPRITFFSSLQELFSQSPESTIFFWEQASQPLKEILSLPAVRHARSIRLIIGPEGGFTEEEAQKAVVNGGMIASLGKRIFRVATAALYAVSVVKYELNHLGE